MKNTMQPHQGVFSSNIPSTNDGYGKQSLLGGVAVLALFLITLVAPQLVLAYSTGQDLNAAWQTDATNGFDAATSSAGVGTDPIGLYINTNDTNIPMIFTGGEGLNTFDLTDFTINNYGSTSDISLDFTGYKAGGGTVTINKSATVALEADQLFTTFTGFTGLTGFEVMVTNYVSWNVTMVSFTIANITTTGSIPPILAGGTDQLFAENTVNATPQAFATGVTVTDTDSTDFDTGQLQITYGVGGSSEDQLSVGNIGNITQSGGNVSHGVTNIGIGSWSGGANGNDLIVALNANATLARTIDLIHALTYGNSSNAPTSHRTLAITVSDGDGATSSPLAVKISVAGEPDGSLTLPALTHDVNATWLEELNNGFIASGTGGVGSDVDALWDDAGGETVTLTISSGEAFLEGEFDLTGITWDVVSSGVDMEVTIQGTRGDGSTVSTSGTVSLNSDVITVTGINYTPLTDIVSFAIISTHPSGSSGNNVGISAFSIANPGAYVGNVAPVLGDLADGSFQENTVNGAAQQISNVITASDTDSFDFDGGQITVGFTSGGSAQDQLSLISLGNISISGGNISHGVTNIGIGSWSGGTNGSDLIVALNANATPARTNDLLRATAYGNSSGEPTSYRTVSFTLSDGDGGTSNILSAQIAVVGEHEGTPEAPLTQDLSSPDWIDNLNNGFTVSISDPGTLGGDATSLWIKDSTSGTSAMVFTSAEQLTGGKFDLTGMSFDIHTPNVSITFTVTITGMLASGGTVTASATGFDNGAFNAISLSQMVGITSFTMTVTSVNSIANVGLDAFTIANVSPANTAPSIGDTPLSVTVIEDTLSDINLSAVTFADADGDSLTVTLAISGGTFSTPVDEVGVSEALLDSTTITLAGLAGDINAYLNTASNIKYTGAGNVNGTAMAIITISATDGIASLASDPEVNIDITAVNDVPSFTKGADQTANEDGGVQTATGWATSISKGPADESAQTVTFEITNNTNSALFSAGPAITSNGNLTYTPAANANGNATVTLRLTDDGGTANGGADTSATQSFSITINSVNDAPAFTKGADQTVDEDGGTQTSSGWATSISKGPADELAQTVTFGVTNNTNSALFSAGPAITSNGNLTYTPATNANGGATITLRVQDNGTTANGGVDTSATQSFTITVNPVNDAPTGISLTGSAVDENQVINTVIGTLSTIDVDD
jgi:hypothetical protein